MLGGDAATWRSFDFSPDRSTLTLAVSPRVAQYSGFTSPNPMLIEIRQAGRRARPLDGWSVPTEPLLRDSGGGLTLRELIARIVRAEVSAFERR
ncbi:MAG TPA: hypothetical protein VFS33_11530, partial [Gemmatimonadales bacterium]|nr:hypothetical protein [Gemmatimonadales bacterium]